MSDEHTKTAAKLYGVPEDAVTPEQRRLVKFWLFAECYGGKQQDLAGATPAVMAEIRAKIEAEHRAQHGCGRFRSDVNGLNTQPEVGLDLESKFHEWWTSPAVQQRLAAEADEAIVEAHVELERLRERLAPALIALRAAEYEISRCVNLSEARLGSAHGAVNHALTTILELTDLNWDDAPNKCAVCAGPLDHGGIDGEWRCHRCGEES